MDSQSPGHTVNEYASLVSGKYLEGDFESAQNTLESALSQYPDNPTLLLWQGLVAEALGDNEAMYTAYQSLTIAYPTNPVFWGKLGFKFEQFEKHPSRVPTEQLQLYFKLCNQLRAAKTDNLGRGESKHLEFEQLSREILETEEAMRTIDEKLKKYIDLVDSVNYLCCGKGSIYVKKAINEVNSNYPLANMEVIPEFLEKASGKNEIKKEKIPHLFEILNKNCDKIWEESYFILRRINGRISNSRKKRLAELEETRDNLKFLQDQIRNLDGAVDEYRNLVREKSELVGKLEKLRHKKSELEGDAEFKSYAKYLATFSKQKSVKSEIEEALCARISPIHDTAFYP